MTRCDYDVIFYRVFCLSLLVIAFIFTVILTNVFVDIDGLLSKKDKTDSNHNTELYAESTVSLLKEMKPEIMFNEERNYEDAEDGYRKDEVYVNEEETFRNKRSLESNSFLFHLQNPSLKHVLTNHLNALLEQLDAEDFSTNSIDDRKPNENNGKYEKISNEKKIEISKTNVTPATNVSEGNNTDNAQIIKTTVEINDTNDTKSKPEDKSHNEMLHLAMHDILLQGIIGHMDLKEVYSKINTLTKKLEAPESKQDENNSKNEHKTVKQERQKNEENNFFTELTQCKKLQKQIRDAVEKKEMKHKARKAVEFEGKPLVNQIRNAVEKKETKHKARKAGESEKPQMVIKAVIDISGTDDKIQQDNDLNSQDVKGLIKFVYKGKPIKVKIISSSEQVNSSKPTAVILPKSVMDGSTEKINEKEITKPEMSDKNDETETFESSPIKFNIPQSYLNKAIANYFKKYDHLKSNPNDYLKSKRSFNNKRFKRHIKIHYDPLNNKTKSEDDELYVEIETHFDSKGMKGEKRKKLIRNLIEKIENAIHTNVDAKSNKTKKHYHAHVKKRLQNPLAFEKILEHSGQDSTFVLKKLSALQNEVERRHLDPISKLVNANKKTEVPGIYDKSGENWKQRYGGPGFLTPAKSMNSAELSEVDVDYNRVITFNGIPQRLQKPLNTDNSDEALGTNYYDLGNLNFFIKDIDHSGISVGFNQYTDEEPDPETIKVFTGVDNLVKAYNHNYGKNELIDESNAETQFKNQYDYNNNALIHNDHNIIRRSAVEEDYHSNEYKGIYDTHYLPYKNYEDIFGIKTNNRKKHINKTKLENSTDKPLTMDIFDKKLKPSEIFSIANMLEEYRKKRSITVKKYSNINTRRRLNKYLQTKTNKIFINKKRMKRHIDKIRIIATDKGKSSQVPFRRPDDHNIFVVSNEDDFSNRAVLREVLQSGEEANNDRIQERPEKAVDVYDYSPNQPDLISNIYEENQPVQNYVTHIFDGRSRHNPLMSKYPHVFLEEIGKSKENDMEPAVYSNIKNVMSDVDNKYNIDQYDMPVPVFETITEDYPTVQNISRPKMPGNTKAKYKVSVKILPKNVTELKAGFKEIHTSINKSYDKDGLRFYSLVNVSEISKVENIDNTNVRKKNGTIITTTTPNPRIKAQQFKIKSMLKRHKQMIDLQLAHLNKEKEHLDNIMTHNLNQNQSDSDEVLDIKLPGEERPLHMKKSELSKLLGTVLRNDQNRFSTPVVTPHPQPLYNFQSPTITRPTPIVSSTVPTQVNIPKTIPMKATDKKLINIIEKNGKLTKEILNKIDRNTEMLEAFLVKLIDKIEDKYEKSTKPVEEPVRFQGGPVNNPKDHQMYPLQENFSIGRLVQDKNDTNYPIPFIYAYQHPYANPENTNSAVENVVYHGHIHTDNRKLSNEVLKANSQIVAPKSAANSEVAKLEGNKGKFFIDNDLANGYKVINSAVVTSTKYVNPTTTVNPTQS